MPMGKKSPPPKGYTGAGAQNPTDATVAEWVRDFATGNIGLRLAEVGRDFWPEHLPPTYNGQFVDGWELLGIDIDDGRDGKTGATQRAELEAKYGDLPASLLSSARWGDPATQRSLIAVYWVPKGYRFHGKAAESIEVVQKRHRYMVVHPSWNPDADATYYWGYGVPAEGLAAAERIDGAPVVGRAAVLPEPWLRYLTTGADEGAAPASDLDFGELSEWAEATFNDAPGEPCARMAEMLHRHKTALTAEDSHTPLNDAVWSLTCEAMEGHGGWGTAVRDYLDRWIEVSAPKRDLAEMDGEIGRSIHGALSKQHPAWEAIGSYMPDDRCDDRGHDPDEWTTNLVETSEADFWAARPELADCLQFARSRRVGPWAMFGHALVLCMSIVPPNTVLPPIVGTVAGLNMFVALTGPSGAIKSAAMGAAADWLQIKPEPKLVKPGSGEGLAKCYAFIDKPRGQPAQQIGKEWSLVAHIPEVDTLNATGSRGGSTLMSELRCAWSGERLGHDYAGEDKAITLAANRYRLGMTVGVQPERARPLFEDATGGTPQRFIWMPTDDPTAPEERPREPSAWSLTKWPDSGRANPVCDADFDRKMSLGLPADKSRFVVMVVPQRAWDMQDAHTLAKLRDPASVDPLDGHKLLARLKVAAALMVLNGRYDKVSEEDWELAGMVMAVSDRTREHVREQLAAEALERNRSAGKAAAYREMAADETKAAAYDEKVRRVAGNISNALKNLGGRAARTKVRNKIAQRDRAAYFDEAEEWLLSRARINKTEITVNGTDGFELELLSGGTDVS